MNNFQRCLDILQGNTVLTEAKTFTKMEAMDGKLYVGKIPTSIRKEIDSDTLATVTGVCMCKDGSIWISEAKDPKDNKATWKPYHVPVLNRVKKDTGKSNSKGDDSVAKRLRDREGK